MRTRSGENYNMFQMIPLISKFVFLRKKKSLINLSIEHITIKTFCSRKLTR